MLYLYYYILINIYVKNEFMYNLVSVYEIQLFKKLIKIHVIYT